MRRSNILIIDIALYIHRIHPYHIVVKVSISLLLHMDVKFWSVFVFGSFHEMKISLLEE